MTPDSASTTPTSDSASPLAQVNCYIQVRIKNESGRIILSLPTEKEFTGDWSELLLQFKHRLNSSECFWQSQTPVHLHAKDRLLDGRQLQDIVDVLQILELPLKLIVTSRRQTAVAAATAGYSVQQEDLAPSLAASTEAIAENLAEPLYLQKTIRSGIEVRHPGTLIVLGDVNPGGSVIAAGDIIIWGCLRGLAHAGASGDRQRRIMALAMKPTQLRIANVVARAPGTAPEKLEPEVAYVTSAGIRLAKAVDFDKSYSFSSKIKSWRKD